MKIIVFLLSIFLVYQNSCGFGETNKSANLENAIPTASPTPTLQSNGEKQTIIIENNKFSIKDFSFELKNENTGCFLIYEKGDVKKKLKIEVPLPCAFVRRGYEEFPEGKDVLVEYESQKMKIATIFIGGNVKKVAGRMCDYYMSDSTQEILISETAVKLGIKNGEMCFPFGKDIQP